MGDLSKNFSLSEFACPCGQCKTHISPVLIEKLQQFRDFFGGPVVISRGGGYRCASYNEKIGGAESSQHMQGIAVDLPWPGSGALKYRYLELAFMLKFRGVGVYDGHVHLDMRHSETRVVWTGKSKTRHLSVVRSPS